jgi:uncharacterized membrane protein
MLSALGLALSAYLGWHYLTGAKLIGCGGGQPCERVLGSRWATIGGVLPVSGLAAGVYLAMLTASAFIGSSSELIVRRLAWRSMLVLVGAAAGSAVWFIILQKWFVDALCPYCMATHLIGLSLAALVFWQAPRQFDDEQIGSEPAQPAPNSGTGGATAALVARRPLIGLSSVIGTAAAGLALAGVLAVCQTIFIPSSAYRAGQWENAQPSLDPRSVPLVGSPDAPYVVNLLFDYECPHCQQLHFMLGAVVRRYGGKVAFALCPSPLNTNCNPYVSRNLDEFKDSCDLAKIALAVWVAKREAFPAFDEWLFSMESGDRWQPRRVAAARAKAAELVGPANFEAALADPRIDQHLQTSIRIYGRTVQDGNNAVPKMVLGSRWVIPQPNDADELISILHDSLAIPPP